MKRVTYQPLTETVAHDAPPIEQARFVAQLYLETFLPHFRPRGRVVPKFVQEEDDGKRVLAQMQAVFQRDGRKLSVSAFGRHPSHPTRSPMLMVERSWCEQDRQIVLALDECACVHACWVSGSGKTKMLTIVLSGSVLESSGTTDPMKPSVFWKAVVGER